MRSLLFACLGLSLTAFAAPDATPYPPTSSPKGLQVQMIPDALELGIHHAGLNLNLSALLSPEKEAKPGQPTASADGFTFAINQKYAEAIDREIKPLSDKGIVVTLIETFIGILVGAISGWRRGWVDSVLMTRPLGDGSTSSPAER